MLDELRRDLSPGNDVHETYLSNLDPATRGELRDGAGAIRLEQPTAGHRSFERRCSTLTKRRIGRTQDCERRRPDHRERTARRVERHVRRNTHDDLKTSVSALQFARRADERIEMTLDLLSAT